MANEVTNSLRTAAERIVQYIEDAVELKVQTGYVSMGTDLSGDVTFDTAKPIAITVIKLNGDSRAAIPVRENSDGELEIDTALLELHQRNLDSAIEYRDRILHALFGLLQSLRR